MHVNAATIQAEAVEINLSGALAKIGVNLSEMIAQAINAKKAQEVEKLSAIEATPRGYALTWKTTPEQVARINAGEQAAVDDFYFDNFNRIRAAARACLRRNYYVISVVSYEDLMQQVYVDLRTGVIKLRPFDKAINGAIYRSFRYAPVGGADDVYIYKKGD